MGALTAMVITVIHTISTGDSGTIVSWLRFSKPVGWILGGRQTVASEQAGIAEKKL